MSKRPRTTYDGCLLSKIAKRDNCTFKYAPAILNSNVSISGTCECGTSFRKNFSTMNRKGGGYCDVCTKRNKIRKQEETCLVNHGVRNPSQNPEIKKKQEDTCLVNHGVRYPSQNPMVMKKVEQTCLTRYGETSAMKNATVAERASRLAYKCKDYTFPCGTVVKVQGYEPRALNELVAKGYSFVDVCTSRTDVPDIRYSLEGKEHRYFTDIFLPRENKVIEVKSTRTYEINTNKTHAKLLACQHQGYNTELWVYTEKSANALIFTDFTQYCQIPRGGRVKF